MTTLVVLPSYTREGVPNCLIEAMALGVPIVTTNNVGCRECVDDGTTGYLVSVRNPQALADAIEKITFDDHKCKNFGLGSRKKVENDFDEQRVFERLLLETYQ
jgi:glycosyltransferase involved in cell wall biosynthesis